MKDSHKTMLKTTTITSMAIGFLVALFAPTAITIAASSTTQTAITKPGNMTIRNNGAGDWAGNTGFEFTVGDKNVVVTSLGIYDAPGNKKTPDKGKAGDGLEQPAIVTIYQVKDKAKVAQVTIPAGDKGTLNDDYRYSALAKPITLKAGERYAIMIGVSKGGNGFRNYKGGSKPPVANKNISNLIPVFATRGNASHAAYPTGSRGGKYHGVAYSGPNFKYELSEKSRKNTKDVKEDKKSTTTKKETQADKSSISSKASKDSSVDNQPAIAAPGDMTLRNNGTANWSGNTGFEFTVGDKSVVVTSLGIYDAPGNEKTPDKGKAGDGLEQDAVVAIYRVGAKIKVAQVIIPAGNKSTLKGQYRYAKLKSPVLLRAGVKYRIVIGINSGGNGFRNYHGGEINPTYSKDFSGYKAYFVTKGNATHPAYPTGMRHGAAYSGPNFIYHYASPEQVKKLSEVSMVQTINNFEDFHVNNLPSGWSVYPHPDHGNAIKVTTPGADRSIHALRFQQDWNLRKLSEDASLVYTLPHPVKRISIEFDVKWSKDRSGPPLTLFTKGPDPDKASQIKLRIGSNYIAQNGGIINRSSYKFIANESKESSNNTSYWHRVRFIASQDSNGISVWISKAGQTTLPDKPTITLRAYGVANPIASVHFGVGKLRNNFAWIDNLVIKTGKSLPKPDHTTNIDLSKQYKLWVGKTFPRTFEQIPYPKDLKFHMIHNSKHWSHGASIAWHKGKLYATWAHNTGGENSPGEYVLGSHSSDGGKTWSKPIVVAPGDGQGGKTYSNSHGVLLNYKGTLWGFFQHWKGGWNNPLAIEAFTLNDKTGKWESKGVVAHKGWPIDPPQHLDNGNWAIGLSGFKMRHPAVAISHGSDFLHWDTVKIPEPGKSIFQETSLIAYGNHLMNITRRGRWAWVANSKDGGLNWTQGQPSNYPNVANPSSGILSTGQWFLISNMNTRDDLEIGVGKPGQHGLSKLYRIRYGSPPEAPYAYKGKIFPHAYAYPSYVEHDGKLYVVYSVAKRDIELAVIPVSSLKAD